MQQLAMTKKTEFAEMIEQGYAAKGDCITLGAAMLGQETMTGSLVQIPLKTLNRHGLIAGATGTGKSVGTIYPRSRTFKHFNTFDLG